MTVSITVLTALYVCVCVHACVHACVCACVHVCARALVQVWVCAFGCCFVSANGLLADVCQCCCLLMFVCLPLSRHFPCCKTSWIENLNLNMTTNMAVVLVLIGGMHAALHDLTNTAYIWFWLVECTLHCMIWPTRPTSCFDWWNARWSDQHDRGTLWWLLECTLHDLTNMTVVLCVGWWKVGWSDQHDCSTLCRLVERTLIWKIRPWYFVLTSVPRPTWVLFSIQIIVEFASFDRNWYL